MYLQHIDHLSFDICQRNENSCVPSVKYHYTDGQQYTMVSQDFVSQYLYNGIIDVNRWVNWEILTIKQLKINHEYIDDSQYDVSKILFKKSKHNDIFVCHIHLYSKENGKTYGFKFRLSPTKEMLNAHPTMTIISLDDEYDEGNDDELDEPFKENVDIRNDGETFTGRMKRLKHQSFKTLRMPFIVTSRFYKYAPEMSSSLTFIAFMTLIMAYVNAVNGMVVLLTHIFPYDIPPINLILGLTLPYIISEYIIMPILISITSRFYREDEHQNYQDQLNQLNRIVEFENDPNVAHRMYEFIDLTQSNKDTLVIDYQKQGAIQSEILVQKLSDDTELSPRQLAMKHYVMTEPMTNEELNNIVTLIKSYQETKTKLDYQRAYEENAKAFSKGQHEINTPLQTSLDKLNDELESYRREIDSVLQDKMKKHS